MPTDEGRTAVEVTLTPSPGGQGAPAPMGTPGLLPPLRIRAGGIWEYHRFFLPVFFFPLHS